MSAVDRRSQILALAAREFACVGLYGASTETIQLVGVTSLATGDYLFV